MKTRLGTLLLLGLTVAAASVSGCIVTSSGGRGDPAYCASYRYFSVYWEVDSGAGTPVFTCASTPASHVELTTNTGLVLQVSRSCDDTRLYNWYGETVADLDPGTTVVTATLISDTDLSVLSTADVPPSAQVRIPSCDPVTVQYQFGI